MYVITNGNTYITKSRSGKVGKTSNILEAEWFDSIDIANIIFQHAPGKTKGYYIKDLETCYVYKRYTNGKIKFPREVRELIYNNAEGKCVLCGRKITYDDMTLDHIKPLANGGKNTVTNLQCTCEACNKFKGSILPEDFRERVIEIFMYQTSENTKHKIMWSITRRLLSLCIKL